MEIIIDTQYEKTNTLFINNLIYIETEIVSCNINKTIINTKLYGYISPVLFTILDQYSNEDIVNQISIKYYIDKIYKNLLYNIILITCRTNNFIYLDYLLNRKINLNDIELTFILECSIIYILVNNRFDIIKYLIEYGICISNSNILSKYIFVIFEKIIPNNTMNLSERSEDKELFSETLVEENTMNLSERSEDKELFSETLVEENTMNLSERSEDKELFSGVSTKENTYIDNIIYLIDNGAYFNDETENKLLLLKYLNDIYWHIRKDYIQFIDGISKCTETNENYHIHQYLCDELIMRDILSYRTLKGDFVEE